MLDTYAKIVSRIEKDLPIEASPIGTAILDFLSTSEPEDATSISYGALKRLVKKRLNFTPDDTLLLDVTQYLLGYRVHLLDANFDYFDNETEEWHSITKETFVEAKNRGEFNHPTTNDPIEDFESHIYISYSSSDLIQQIKK